MLASAFRSAVRSLRRSPGFVLLGCVILALGIGSTTAMVSIARTVLLKPLGYTQPEQLITVLFRVPQIAKDLATIPANAQHLQLWRESARTLSEVAMIGPASYILSGRGRAVQIAGARVTPNLFHLLGVRPRIGRSFLAGEDQNGRDQVIILSDAFWKEKLGGRSDVLGQRLRLDGKPFVVIGVMAADFPFPRGAQLSDLEKLPEKIEYWIPLVFDKGDLESPLGNFNFIPIARMRPGVKTATVLSELTALEKIMEKRFPEPVEIDPVVNSLNRMMARDVRTPLLILLAAVGAVLLIVCINLMNLMMVRAVAQRRERAIRIAIGAATRDLLSAAFLESLILSLTGGTLGCLLSGWLLAIVRLNAPSALPRVDELGLDGTVLACALLLSVTSAMLFGLYPAWRATRIDPQEALRASSRSSTEGKQGLRSGRLLIALEVALSTVLLLSAGLLVRSFAAILSVNPGVAVENVLTARVNLPPDKYKDLERIHSLYDRLQERMKAVPGVLSAGVVSDLAMTGQNYENPVTAGDRPVPPLVQWIISNYRWASPSYFATSGIPVKSGSVMFHRDKNSREAVISERLAERLWPGQDAVGHPLRLYGDKMYKVIGVAGEVYAGALTAEAPVMVYMPHWASDFANMSLVVRTGVPPNRMSGTVRNVIGSLEPEAAIARIESMEEVRAASVAPQRFQMILLLSFAAAALILACLGIYGVVSFATGQRTSEIGIRMALGARPGQILAATLGGGMKPVAIGVAVGLAVSLALARTISSLLFNVRALDPVLYAMTGLILLMTAAMACYLPARRAARRDPTEALRQT